MRRDRPRTPEAIVARVEHLMTLPGWQVADFQLRHEPLWRRIVRKFSRR